MCSQRVFDDAYYHPDRYRYPGMFEHLRKTPSPLSSYPFFERALNMFSDGALHKFYGVRLFDVLQLDCLAFDQLEQHLQQTVKKHVEALKSVAVPPGLGTPDDMHE